ncbi:MAG: sensor histidine kinase, partial [Thermoanaerobaculia bacterium]|nr:sensor histidine kinase [Thermoanaerobaculia bacterium]
ITESEHRRLELEKAHVELEEKRASLENLSMQFIQMQEAERERIARELHDELGGILTGLYFDVSWLRERLGDESLLGRADEMGRQIEKATKKVRDVARELRPKVIDDFGLIPALEDLVGEFSERYGIEANLSVRRDGTEKRRSADINVYRIVQEALTNVARHSGADQAEVRLHYEEDYTMVEIRDNGHGTSRDEIDSPEALGVAGMRERAELLGGSFSIETFDGKGTIVRVRIPNEGKADEPVDAGR